MNHRDITQETMIADVFATACRLPYCKIDREQFLTKQLKGKITSEKLSNALENGTLFAGIPLEILDSIAIGSIKLEATRVTALSAAAGIPGGFAMIGTVPADLAQFYAHVFRIAQKLAYIYGHKDIDIDDAAQNVLIIFLGVMFGVNVANAVLVKFAYANAAKIGARIAAKPLSKYAIYNIAKKVLAWISIKLTKDLTGKTISKTIPFVGGILSGSVTFATFFPMAKKLESSLSKLAHLSPDALIKATLRADRIIAKFDTNNNTQSESDS